MHGPETGIMLYLTRRDRLLANSNILRVDMTPVVRKKETFQALSSMVSTERLCLCLLLLVVCVFDPQLAEFDELFTDTLSIGLSACTGIAAWPYW